MLQVDGVRQIKIEERIPLKQGLKLKKLRAVNLPIAPLKKGFH